MKRVETPCPILPEELHTWESKDLRPVVEITAIETEPVLSANGTDLSYYVDTYAYEGDGTFSFEPRQENLTVTLSYDRPNSNSPNGNLLDGSVQIYKIVLTTMDGETAASTGK